MNKVALISGCYCNPKFVKS